MLSLKLAKHGLSHIDGLKRAQQIRARKGYRSAMQVHLWKHYCKVPLLLYGEKIFVLFLIFTFYGIYIS